MVASVSFATFCWSGDIEKLYAPGQLKKQIDSCLYDFSEIIVVHQNIEPLPWAGFDIGGPVIKLVNIREEEKDSLLKAFGISLDGQYQSDTDQLHWWKNHVVNHLMAVELADSDYIVFADADCWIINPTDSWIKYGIAMLEHDDKIFIVSPNYGEQSRYTRRMSQQMFMARTEEFRNADFNQPGWDRNPHVPGGPMPEYWSMAEGRIELHCRAANKYRFVSPPEYRYWHHNRFNDKGLFEIDYSKY